MGRSLHPRVLPMISRVRSVVRQVRVLMTISVLEKLVTIRLHRRAPAHPLLLPHRWPMRRDMQPVHRRVFGRPAKSSTSMGSSMLRAPSLRMSSASWTLWMRLLLHHHHHRRRMVHRHHPRWATQSPSQWTVSGDPCELRFCLAAGLASVYIDLFAVKNFMDEEIKHFTFSLYR